MKTIRLLPLLLLPASLFAAVLVDDTFSDNDRSTQNPPSSLKWFGTSTSSLTIGKTADGATALRNAPTGKIAQHLVAYLPAPLTLSPGDTVTFFVTLVPEIDILDATPNLFRIGLFESGNSRLSSDSNSDLSLKNGYAAFLAPLKQTADIRQRIAVSGPLLSSLRKGLWSGTFKPTIKNNPFPLKRSIPVTIALSIARTGNSTDTIQLALSTGTSTPRTITVTNTKNILSAIDTLAFAWSAPFGPASITRITLNHDKK